MFSKETLGGHHTGDENWRETTNQSDQKGAETLDQPGVGQSGVVYAEPEHRFSGDGFGLPETEVIKRQPLRDESAEQARDNTGTWEGNQHVPKPRPKTIGYFDSNLDGANAQDGAYGYKDF